MASFTQLPLIPAEAQSPVLDLLDLPRILDAFAGECYAPRANPTLTRFIESHAGTRESYATDPFPGNLVAGKNTHVYDAHTYHTKVPPEAIAPLLEHYTQPGDLVLDPFCGSGMTGVAALKTERKPILSDLSPAATFIALNYVTLVDAREYMQAVNEILAAVKDEELTLYGTRCRKCGKMVPAEYMVWSYGLRCQFCDQEFVLWDVARDERPDVRESKIRTEFDCPHCGKRLEKRRLQRTRLYPVQVGYWCCQGGQQEAMAIPDDFDRRTVDISRDAAWYPRAKLPHGVNTRQAIAHGFTTVDSLYTERNLVAVARLWDVARRWPDRDISAKLMFTVTSLYQRVTRLSEFRFWGGSGNIANYNIPMIFNEQNVFRVFERKAKTIRNYLATWDGHPREPFCISTQSATDLAGIPDNTIDYIFTDPPFGDNINYSEMNFLWEAWLGVYTDTTHEAIINRVQGKTIDDYRELMTRAIGEMHRILKPGRWLSLVFHNSSADVWAALQAALTAGGFHIEQTQTLDKRHGTFKQFVSDNAVGYDLIIHCQKTPANALPAHALQAPASSRASVHAFAQRILEQAPEDFVVHYLHVRREDELDSRKLFSLWIKERMEAGEVVDLDYHEFREIIGGFRQWELASAQFALLNGRIALPDRIVEGKALIVEDASITGLADPDDLPSNVERVDVAGRLIAPGLVDIHTHGALGHTFNEPTAEAWAAITAENARRGVTSLLATLAAAPIPDLVACLEFARAWVSLRGAGCATKQSASRSKGEIASHTPLAMTAQIASHTPFAMTAQIASHTPLAMTAEGGARVLGIHLESPYISPAQRGALDPASLRSPDDGSAAGLLSYADVLRVFVLAPELLGALDLVAALTARGVIVAAGHSTAKDEQVLAAMRAGLRHVTHVWSAMSSVVREGPWRKPGLLESALAFDGLTVEMIADNRHLPPTLMKLAYRAIGPDRLCVISDATAGAGLPDGSRFRMGAMEYEVRDGVGMMFDRSAFGGSATLLPQMLPILTGVVGIPLVEAVRMVTLTPARAIGVADRLGSIAPGKTADLTIFDDDFTPWRVMIGGRWVGE